MLHNHTADNLLFHTLLLDTRHKLTAPIRDSAVLAPLFHGWRVLVTAKPLNAYPLKDWTFLVWNKLYSIVRHGEIKHSETRETDLVNRGLDDLEHLFITVQLDKTIH